MTHLTIARMQQAHKVLAEFPFAPVRLSRGYANRSLRIDMGANKIEIRPVTQQMKDLWVGGKGFDLWLMFQEITGHTRWDSPENPICMSSGPLGGTTSFPGSGKTLVTALSPLTQSIIDCNVGGYFGPFLKFAGFDALCIVGKAKTDVIVRIDAVQGKIYIEEAPLESLDSHLIAEELTEMYADDEADKRNIAIVSTGRAAEYSRIGMLNFSFWDWRRGAPRFKQAGRGGLGRVFRDKHLKALVLKNRQIIPAWQVEKSKVAKFFELAPAGQPCAACSGLIPFEREGIDAILQKWNRDPDYVIEMMQDIQDKDRHISKEAISQISLSTGVSKGMLYHIATFYKAFSLAPRGETVIQVCVGTACHVKGSAKLLETFERELDIPKGQTTPDQKFTLEAVACLGCCGIAPVVKLGDEVVGGVKTSDIKKLIKKYRNGIQKAS